MAYNPETSPGNQKKIEREPKPPKQPDKRTTTAIGNTAIKGTDKK